nr:Uma2 family endonuclease [Candidatus Cyanaurora vandensis]
MPTTLTLKNIPDTLYERLKASAQKHRRGLNSEAIVCLESVQLPIQITQQERLARARALPNGAIRSPNISWIRQDRWDALTPKQKRKFAPVCPDFVPELLSPTDELTDI